MIITAAPSPLASTCLPSSPLLHSGDVFSAPGAALLAPSHLHPLPWSGERLGHSLGQPGLFSLMTGEHNYQNGERLNLSRLEREEIERVFVNFVLR